MGVFTRHIDDILGCGDPDVMAKMRIYLEHRFGGLKLQESPFAHAAMQ